MVWELSAIAEDTIVLESLVVATPSLGLKTLVPMQMENLLRLPARLEEKETDSLQCM